MSRHLSIEERDCIVALLAKGFTLRHIGERLGRSHATISRELRRNGDHGVYGAAEAQARAVRRRRLRPLTPKAERPQINNGIRAGLARYWSPEQTSGRLELAFPDDPAMRISTQTIYDWIESQPPDEREHWHERLRRSGKKPRKPRENTAAEVARIEGRPEIVESRGRLGDFEGDTVLGRPGTGGVITLVDRRSRYTIVEKTQDKTADRVYGKIRKRLKPLPESKRRTLTFDNGTEFARCPLLTKSLNLPVYFARPGKPQQRGSNENTNGLLRQFFPKGTDFNDVTHSQVKRAENLLNDRPRKCLGYRTPNEVFAQNSP